MEERRKKIRSRVWSDGRMKRRARRRAEEEEEQGGTRRKEAESEIKGGTFDLRL